MEKLKINSLNFSYPSGDFLLKNINLAVEEGELLLVMGKSGSGKSTLLRLLKPVERPFGTTDGKIYYNEKEEKELTDFEKNFKIGFVGQDPEASIVTDTIKAELEFSLSNMGLSSFEISSRCAEIADFFGITDWYFKKTDELSGGEKQILNLASVMVTKPEILLLDEPTSRQDPINAEKFINLLAKIKNELGTTIIIAEHKVEDLFLYADKIMVLEEGKVFAFGKRDCTAKFLKKENHPISDALPTVTKISLELSEGESVCATINEGRTFLKEFKKENEIKNELSLNKNDEKKENIISLKEVCFSYRDEGEVLKNLSLDVRKNEILSLFGKNGAGKSTLLKIISGLEKTKSAKVLFCGKSIDKTEDFYEKILAFVPQNPKNLFSGKNLWEDYYKVMKNLDSNEDEIKMRILKITKMLGISDKLLSHPLDLSGGEIEKAAIGLALLKDPELLLLDEPTKGIDAESKNNLGKILLMLKNEGKTIIIVSHDTEFCARVSDRCALLFSGEIIALGNSREFFSKNLFFTTKAKLMAEDIVKNAVSEEDILCAFGRKIVKREEKPPKDVDIKIPEKKVEKPNKKRIFLGITSLVLSFVAQWCMLFLPSVILLILGVVLLFSTEEIPVLKREDNSLSKKDIISFLLLFLLTAITIILGGENYYLISILLILESLFVFFARFEKKEKKANEIVIISIISAIAVASRMAFYALPQVKPITAIVIISGICLGGESGFLIGCISAFCSNFFFGQGPWTIYQMAALGLVGFLGGSIFKIKFIKRTKLFMSAFAFFSTFVFYGFIVNVSSLLLTQENPTLKMLYLKLVAGLPFDLVHALSTAFFVWFLSGDMIKTLERIKQKYGFFNKKI